MDTLSEMAAFVRVVSAGSLSAAARQMGISVPVVSKRLKRLEERLGVRLGVRLLSRSTRRLNLTEEGTDYYERSARILAEIEEAEASLAAGRLEPRGTLRISTPAAFGRLHVAPAIPRFMARYPGVRVHLDLDERLVDLIEERFDLAIRIADLVDSSMVARQLAPNRRVLCAAPAYLKKFGEPKTPADLVRHNCLVISLSNARQDVWQFVGPDGPVSVRVSGNAECNNGEVQRDWALAGLGLALKSTWDVGQYLRSGKLKAVLAEYTPSGVGIYAVYPHRQHLSARVRAFVEFMQEQFGPEPYWDRGFELERATAGGAGKDRRRAALTPGTRSRRG